MKDKEKQRELIVEIMKADENSGIYPAMKQTAVQQAIAMVRSRMESQNETLIGKHTAHHLQQVERDLYNLLEEEKEQIEEAFLDGYKSHPYLAEEYYKETYEQKIERL